MSSEIYYSPAIEEKRRKELYNQWVEELKTIKMQLDNLTKNNQVKVEVQKQESIQQQSEEWIYQKKEFHENMPVFEKVIYETKIEEIDFSDSFKQDIDLYTRTDLEIFDVRTKVQLMKKRALLIKLEDSYSDEMQKHQMISDFFEECGSLSEEEKEEIMEYRMMLHELQISESEKCYDDVLQEAYLVKRDYFAMKERKYIHEHLMQVLKEEGILYEGESREEGIIKNEFVVDEAGDALLQVTESGSKRMLFEYVGVEDGIQSLSEEDKKRIVSKGKEFCKKVNRVIERLQREYGIQMEISHIEEPALETIKTIRKKDANRRKQDRQESKRISYEV